MKRSCLIVIFIILTAFLTFGETGEQEEIDFLLFLPDSSDGFVNEDEAMIQLDNVANFLLGRAIYPDQICVYGYAALAFNDIEPVDLSLNRALFVIDELKKRGVTGDAFSDPVGFGSVDLWGMNFNEAERSPNRRVRILLEGRIITPDIIRIAESENVIPDPSNDVVIYKPVDDTLRKPSKFPWGLLLFLLGLLLAALLLFLLFKKRKRPIEAVVSPAPPVSPVIPGPDTGIAAAKIIAPVIPAVIPAVISYTVVNLEEEIRFRAYELFLERNGQNGDAESDWHRAVIDVGGRYEAEGCQVYTEEGSWWARRPVI